MKAIMLTNRRHRMLVGKNGEFVYVASKGRMDHS